MSSKIRNSYNNYFTDDELDDISKSLQTSISMVKDYIGKHGINANYLEMYLEKARHFHTSFFELQKIGKDLLSGNMIEPSRENYNSNHNEIYESKMVAFSGAFYNYMSSLLTLIDATGKLEKQYKKKKDVSIEKFIKSFPTLSPEMQTARQYMMWLYTYRIQHTHLQTTPKWDGWVTHNDSIIYYKQVQNNPMLPILSFKNIVEEYTSILVRKQFDEENYKSPVQIKINEDMPVFIPRKSKERGLINDLDNPNKYFVAPQFSESFLCSIGYFKSVILYYLRKEK